MSYTPVQYESVKIDMLRVCTFIQAILSAFIMLDINPEKEVNTPGGTFF